MPSPSPHSFMKLRGVKVHNLKNITLDIPLHQLIAITGISGSGKSSLAFDTIFVEGQRLLLETLPQSSQQNLSQLERPNATSLEGIPPAFMIRQRGIDLDKNISLGKWSSLTNMLIRIFHQHGTPFCSQCHSILHQFTPEDLLTQFKQLADGTKAQLAFLVPVAKKSDFKKTITTLQQAGFHRVHELTDVNLLQHLQAWHSSSPSENITRRKTKASPPLGLLVIVDRYLIGKHDPNRLLESATLSFREGDGLLLLLTDSPPATEPASQFWTDHDQKQWFCQLTTTRFYCQTCQINFENVTDATTHSAIVNYKLDDLTFSDSLSSPVHTWSKKLQDLLKQLHLETTNSPLLNWLFWLSKLKLTHLALNTQVNELTTGEAQRLNLCRAVNLQLIQTLFVIDEPCAGSNPQEREAIYSAINKLRDDGNSLIVVEHDPDFLKIADQIIDLGPEAGAAGGNILFQGQYPQLLQTDNSYTAAWINKKVPEIYSTKNTHRWQQSPALKIPAPSFYSSSTDLIIPLQRYVVFNAQNQQVNKKSPLAAIYSLICHHKQIKPDQDVPPCFQLDQTSVQGLEHIDDCQFLSGRPRKAHRSQIIITAIDLFTEIRQLFTQTHEARLKGYQPGDFSFYSPKGRKCLRCQGTGVITLNFAQLAPLKSVCPVCHGGRFQPQMNDILYRGLNISQVLQQTIDEAFQFFRNIPKLQKGLFALKEAGLGYLTLGRNLDTLSGGEYQRFLLAQNILAGTGQRILFLFDEPSIGLHPENKHQLLKLFFQLLELGHSIVVFENDRQMTNAAECKI